MVSLEYFGATDPGKVRQNNEDSLMLGGGSDRSLLVVADGIGGFEAGEVASRITVDMLRDLSRRDSISEAIKEANRKIIDTARKDSDLSGMGTTVVAIRFYGRRVEVAHVGDSRAYLIHDGEMNPITEDHSLVAELIRSGEITRDQAQDHPQKNLITRALGAEDSVDVEISEVRVQPGDRILLCTDGLTDMIPEREVERIMHENQDPEAATKHLVSAALDAGGADNVTVIVTNIHEDQSGDDEANGGADGERERTAALPREQRSQDTSEIAGVDPAPRTRRETPRQVRTTNPDARTDRTAASGQQRAAKAPGAKRAENPGYTDKHYGAGAGAGAAASSARGSAKASGGRRDGSGSGAGSDGHFEDPRESRRERRNGLRSGNGGGKLGAVGRFFKVLTRWLVALAVVALILAPAYIWGSSRYFLGVDDDIVVVYRGLPYAPLGMDLSEEWQRTDLQASEVDDNYQQTLDEQRLYSQNTVETVVDSLREG